MYNIPLRNFILIDKYKIQQNSTQLNKTQHSSTQLNTTQHVHNYSICIVDSIFSRALLFFILNIKQPTKILFDVIYIMYDIPLPSISSLKTIQLFFIRVFPHLI